MLILADPEASDAEGRLTQKIVVSTFVAVLCCFCGRLFSSPLLCFLFGLPGRSPRIIASAGDPPAAPAEAGDTPIKDPEPEASGPES